MRFRCVTLCILCVLLMTAGSAVAKVTVVATTPDLADVAKEVGDGLVDVTALAKGYQDPHFVDPKPSFIMILQGADLLIFNGLELETGWLPPLIERARNGKIIYGAAGYLDVSEGIAPLEVPQGNRSELRAQGDVHPAGNPHYMLDPENAKIVAGEICSRLIKLFPEHAADFKANLSKFNARLDGKISEWKAKMEPYRGTKMVTYHRLYPYFSDRFGLQSVAEVEPKPGIPPSPSHVAYLIRFIPESGAKILVMAPYYSEKVPRLLEKRTGIKVLVLPTMPGGGKGTDDYISMMDYIINNIAEALRVQKDKGK
jgi:zinc/manganese transport system substrate-binding protein